MWLSLGYGHHVGLEVSAWSLCAEAAVEWADAPRCVQCWTRSRGVGFALVVVMASTFDLIDTVYRHPGPIHVQVNAIVCSILSLVFNPRCSGYIWAIKPLIVPRRRITQRIFEYSPSRSLAVLLRMMSTKA